MWTVPHLQKPPICGHRAHLEVIISMVWGASRTVSPLWSITETRTSAGFGS